MQQLPDIALSRLDSIDVSPFLRDKTSSVRLFLKREDLIHPVISGNKWRKLKYNVQYCTQNGYEQVLTFGGAFSNHIAATAAAGNLFNIPTIGIIRGEAPSTYNPTLEQAKELGMQLRHVSRAEYKELKNQATNQFSDKKTWIVPEGGANREGVLGCKEIIEDISAPFDYIITACGTGTTLSGLAESISPKQTAIGIPVLKGGQFIEEEVIRLSKREQLPSNCLVFSDYHFGGYAKQSTEVENFINLFRQSNNILLDPVYTGKMMAATVDLINKGFFPENSTIICLHTGGIQGIKGYEQRYGTFLQHP